MDDQSPELSPENSHASPESNAQGRTSSSLADVFSASGRTNSPNSTAPKAILSCDFCRHRKTKCDKAEGGCSNCKRAGIKCNMPTRQRLPRGRNGGRTKVDAELKARVGRLESLVRSLGGDERLSDAEGIERALAEANVQDEPVGGSKPAKTKQSDPSRKNSVEGSQYGKYLGGSFWANLSDEVTGLKEILDDESDQEAESSEGQSRSTPTQDGMSQTNNFSFVLCTPDGMAVSSDAMQHPPRIVQAGLCEIYLRAVDPVFKLLHRPSLANFMQEGQPYLDYPPNHPATEALKFAVYFGAVTSQNDEECRANFGETKAVLSGRYRVALEAALSKADLIITDDLTVLSAFIVYIIFARVLANDRRSWTLLALAVRIGTSMGLHKEAAQPTTSVFLREIRRRVWNCLGVLDLQNAGDRGTEPLIFFHDNHPHATPGPMSINDADLAFGMREEPTEQDGITDMSMPLVCREADFAATKLDFNPMLEWSPNGREDPLSYDWEKRKEFAVEWRKTMHDRFVKHCDPSQKMHQIIATVIEIVALDLLLASIRPLHQHPWAKTPRVSGDYILEVAASALERASSMLHMPAFAEFLWFGRQYNQWHALAVMAAELCVHTHGPTVDRAWAILDSSLDFSKGLIADSEQGMLWRPIEKLLKRAREKRSEALRDRPNYQNMTTSSSQRFSSTNSNTSNLSKKTNAPQTANAAMAFTPYVGPPPDGTSLGLSQEEIQQVNQAQGWSLPPEFNRFDMDFMNFDLRFESLNGVDFDGTIGDSPDTAWQTWGNFTEGLQHDPMQTDQPANSGVGDFGQQSNFSGMNMNTNER